MNTIVNEFLSAAVFAKKNPRKNEKNTLTLHFSASVDRRFIRYLRSTYVKEVFAQKRIEPHS